MKRLALKQYVTETTMSYRPERGENMRQQLKQRVAGPDMPLLFSLRHGSYLSAAGIMIINSLAGY